MFVARQSGVCLGSYTSTKFFGLYDGSLCHDVCVDILDHWQPRHQFFNMHGCCFKAVWNAYMQLDCVWKIYEIVKWQPWICCKFYVVWKRPSLPWFITIADCMSVLMQMCSLFCLLVCILCLYSIKQICLDWANKTAVTRHSSQDQAMTRHT